LARNASELTQAKEATLTTLTSEYNQHIATVQACTAGIVELARWTVQVTKHRRQWIGEDELRSLGNVLATVCTLPDDRVQLETALQTQGLLEGPSAATISVQLAQHMQSENKASMVITATHDPSETT